MTKDITDPNHPSKSPQSPTDFLKYALEGAEVGMWDWNLITDEIRWSPQQERLFELHPGGFGKTLAAFLGLLVPADRDHVAATLQNTIQSRSAIATEFRVPLSDGSVRWLSQRGRVFSNQQGEPVRFAGIAFDITVQKLAEAERLHQIRRERLIAEISQDISHSKNLRVILPRVLSEVRTFLGVDRLIIIDLKRETMGRVTQEDRATAVPSMLNWTLPQTWITNAQSFEQYQNGCSIAVSDIQAQNYTKTERDFLSEFQINASLTIPLLEDGKLHGLLSAHHSIAKNWQTEDWRLLGTLSTQVSMAMQRDRLHQDLTRANRELKRLAYLDGLTKVANRLRFEQFMHQEWRRLARERAPLAIIMADIDYFKAYNDVYGHLAGDDCLRVIAQTLRGAVQRPADMVARYGGEEFAIVLPKTDVEGAKTVAEKIRLLVREQQIPHERSGLNRIVTLSLGVAVTLPHPLESPDTLIQKADQALYEAKKAGRDRIATA
ncbi:MAG: diguanylate cyclase domain-containing protein [Leptolyngbyaceae cyanobacterium]